MEDLLTVAKDDFFSCPGEILEDSIQIDDQVTRGCIWLMHSTSLRTVRINRLLRGHESFD